MAGAEGIRDGNAAVQGEAVPSVVGSRGRAGGGAEVVLV